VDLQACTECEFSRIVWQRKNRHGPSRLRKTQTARRFAFNIREPKMCFALPAGHIPNSPGFLPQPARAVPKSESQREDLAPSNYFTELPDFISAWLAVSGMSNWYFCPENRSAVSSLVPVEVLFTSLSS
jgi:hypothetical protein